MQEPGAGAGARGVMKTENSRNPGKHGTTAHTTLDSAGQTQGRAINH